MTPHLNGTNGFTKASTIEDLDIKDIGGGSMKDDIRKEIMQGLDAPYGKKTLPLSILYDERGLQLFDEITRLDEYYLEVEERSLLQAKAEALADLTPPDSRLIDLGAGKLDKIFLILDAYERLRKPVDYYALDIDYESLQKSLQQVSIGKYSFVKFHGLFGAYDDCVSWARGLCESQDSTERPNFFLSLGSSIGNFDVKEIRRMLSSYAAVMKPEDRFIVAADGSHDFHRTYKAFNDSRGLTADFYWNGISNANKILAKDPFAGRNVFEPEVWELRTEMNVENPGHFTYLVPRVDLSLTLGEDVVRKISRGEKVLLEPAHLFARAKLQEIVKGSGLKITTVLADKDAPAFRKSYDATTLPKKLY